MPVDRCICHGVSFSALRVLATQGELGLIELAKQTGCGTGCGQCVPYVRLMLKSGRTSFPVIMSWQFEQLLGPHCCKFPEAEAIKQARDAASEATLKLGRDPIKL